MRAFFQLKALLAPCIEALVLLDRLLYLLEQVSGALWCKPHIPTAHWLMVSRFSQFLFQLYYILIYYFYY